MKKTAWSVGKNSHHKAPENISAVRNAGIDITNENKNESKKYGGITMYNNNIDKMKQVIRINFEHDTKNELLGFMEVETEAQCDGIHEDYFHPGQVIVFYRSNTMELTFQDIEEMYNSII